MTPTIDPRRLSREELDDLVRRLQVEQDRRNQMLDAEIVIGEELAAAQRRIVERLTGERQNPR